MTLTFHPHVIGRGHCMRMLERLLERLLKEGARFVTPVAGLRNTVRGSLGVSRCLREIDGRPTLAQEAIGGNYCPQLA